MPHNNILKYRKEKGLTLANLSIKTNLSIGYLCHLEKGSRTNPSMRTMQKICIALNKGIEDIFII